MGTIVKFMSIPDAQRNQIPIGSTNIRKEHLFSRPSRKRRRTDEELNQSELYPLVRFNNVAGRKGYVEVLCVPHRFEALTADGKTQIATRVQVLGLHTRHTFGIAYP